MVRKLIFLKIHGFFTIALIFIHLINGLRNSKSGILMSKSGQFIKNVHYWVHFIQFKYFLVAKCNGHKHILSQNEVVPMVGSNQRP